MSFEFKKLCCGCTLQTGAIILAVLSMVKCIALIALIGLQLPVIKNFDTLTYGLSILDIAIWCMSLLSAILVIVSAVKNRNWKLLLPWLTMCNIAIILDCTVFLTVLPHFPTTFGTVVLRCFRIAFDVYSCTVIYSYFRQLKQNEMINKTTLPQSQTAAT